jgi:hypothetical protein
VSASITLDPKAKPADLQPQNKSQVLILDKGTVYLIMSGKKYGFASQTAFLGLGYSFKHVIKGNSAPYPDGGIILSNPSQPHLSGSWVLSDKTVYYVADNGLIPLPSWSIFLSNEGKASFLVKANTQDLKNPLLGLMAENDPRVD